MAEQDKGNMTGRVQFSQWIQVGTSKFIPTDNAKTVKKIIPGVYNLRANETDGFYVYMKDLQLDKLVDLKSKEIKEVLESIDDFWNRKDKFAEYGFVHKRGILLYGPAGSGKSSLINLLSRNLIKKRNGVVFILQTGRDLRLYRDYIAEVFRIIEPDTPITTVIEDIDGLCKYEENETILINILDGLEQLNNVVYIATTNYTESLPERLLNRPNRFDRRVKIGFPDRKTRKAYFQFKMKKEDMAIQDIKKWLDNTDGMTIAHLGELIKSVIILGNNFDETIAILKALKEIPKSSDYNKSDANPGTLGFKRVQDTKYDSEEAEYWSDEFEDED